MGRDLTIAEAFTKWSEDLARYATVLVGPDDAGDVVAQAFADVVASGRWAGIRDHRGYLFRVTLNAARATRRSDGRRRAREWRHRTATVAAADLVADPAIVAAVNRLSVSQRAVIYLAYWEDLTPSSIAEVLGVSDGTVRRQLARGRAALRKALS